MAYFALKVLLIFLEVFIEIKDFIERAGEPIRFLEPNLELSLPLFLLFGEKFMEFLTLRFSDFYDLGEAKLGFYVVSDI